jgi:hypothetical protein
MLAKFQCLAQIQWFVQAHVRRGQEPAEARLATFVTTITPTLVPAKCSYKT